MKTLAVVIGNDAYPGDDYLNNAVNDAKGMANAFERLGYDVLPGYNCGLQNLTNILQEFEERLPAYDASIFYFAGHGFEIDGVNFLTGVECQVRYVQSRHDLRTNSIDLEEILQILRKFDTKVNIIIIDACRSNLQRGAVENSFAPVLAPKGTMIAFSTSPRMKASDYGMGGHSAYTGALLRFIGRQRISVEELFKLVRIVVYDLTGGRQVTWEHTSLIGQFYFNNGQLVHSVAIPYDEAVVKDITYEPSGDFGNIISELKSGNWDRQNPAMHSVWKLSAKTIDKHQQFLLGRNLLQASAYAWKVQDFFSSLADSLRQFQDGKENHVLNGILFEIYFDKSGEFREGNLKAFQTEAVMALRKEDRFFNSFEFISKALEPFQDKMLFIPRAGGSEPMIDVNVAAEPKLLDDFWEGKIQVEFVRSIKSGGADILEQIRNYSLDGGNEQTLIDSVADRYAIPKKLVNINSTHPLTKIRLPERVRQSSVDPFI